MGSLIKKAAVVGGTTLGTALGGPVGGMIGAGVGAAAGKTATGGNFWESLGSGIKSGATAGVTGAAGADGAFPFPGEGGAATSLADKLGFGSVKEGIATVGGALNDLGNNGGIIKSPTMQAPQLSSPGRSRLLAALMGTR